MPENEKQTNRERLKDITDSIERGIQELFQSDKYAAYLRTMSRFHKYSVNNQMLIYMQKPDATLVAGFNKWKDQFERNVMKGEKGIKIIAPTPFKKKIEEQKLDPDTKLPMLDADGKVVMEEKEIKIPMFKPVTVFDVSQTQGKPLPQLASDLQGNVQNYEVFMEALRRASPVPIDFKPIRDGSDGFFSLDNQSITIREGMSEVQTVSAVVHEIAHSKLHNNVGDEQQKDRNTEEVEAESISFAVCAYYGISTGENSFGYIATWSKGKELKELRESLETINKTSSELITDIDRHYAQIMKEREAEIAVEAPVQEEPVLQSPTKEEALYLVDDTVYLHVQPTDGGWDYSLYDKESKKLLDGGIIDTAAIESSPVSSLAGAVRTEVFAIQGMTPSKVVFEDLSVLEGLLAAQLPETESVKTEGAEAIDEIARTVPEETSAQAPDNGYMPDPSMSIAAMNAYGYTDENMLPLSKERALELMERDVPVYMLYDDNSEAMAFEPEDIQMFSGMFAVDRTDWERVRGEIPPMDETLVRQKMEQAFHNSPTDAYAIYQLKRDESTTDLRFMGSDWLQKKGLEPNRDNYDLIYTGRLYPAENRIDTLERLYQTFNIDHPEDFRGHSLSVSDIVALKEQGVVSYHYVDSIGYTELPNFDKNYLKTAEMQLEDDYGMIDGIVNNGAKQPEQPKQNQPVKAADDRSKRPSVLAKLRKLQAEDKQTAARHRSAERDEISSISQKPRTFTLRTESPGTQRSFLRNTRQISSFTKPRRRLLMNWAFRSFRPSRAYKLNLQSFFQQKRLPMPI